MDPSLNATTSGSTTVLSPYDADFSGDAMLYSGAYDSPEQATPSPAPPLATPTVSATPSPYGPDNCDSYNCAESFLQFGGLSSTIAGDSVTAATLNVWDAYAQNCSSPEPFWVSPIEEQWSVTGNKSWPGLQTGTEIGESDTTAPGAACSNTTANPTVGGWMNVNLDPGAFNPSSGSQFPGQPPAAQYGLALSSSDYDDNQWKEFDSFNTPNAPYLSLTYTPLAAPQISAVYPPDNYNSPSLAPVLMASGTEASGVTAPLKYEFTVYNSSGATVNSSGYISASQWTVPWVAKTNDSYTKDLQWGQVYYWTVQAYNGTTYSPVSPISYFSTNVPQPVLTSDLSQNTDGPGFNAADGDYSTEVTDAQVSTAGPALSVERYYNSRDPRISAAFGAGWSSILDMGAVPGQVDPSGNTHTMVVTYPDGEEVAYGLNADGSYAPPPGRYSMMANPSGGGYTLTDKDDTNYNFGAVPSSGGPYTLGGVRIGPLTSITDAYGNTLTLTRNSSGEVTQMTSASGRSLYFTWSTPTGAEYPHVATVSTNDVVAGNSSTALTWTYGYTGDELTSVCSPGGHCTSYSYTTGSDYPAAVLDTDPHSYWRLDESSGTVAASSELVNEGADDATYSGVSLGQPGPLPGSAATSAGFNGTSSYLQLPTNLVSGADVQSFAMWFKTSAPGGVLLSDQASPVTGAQSGSYDPRPTGSVYAQVAYDDVTGAWSTVADSNGGTWTAGPTTVTGSSQEYAGSVLGNDPTDYYRLDGTGTSTATDQVNGGTAVYNDVTEGVAAPFPDTTADSFNGTSSYLALPAADQVTTGPGTIQLWFQTTASDEVLYSANAVPAGSATTSGAYMPSLYIGSDGKLIGRFSNQYAAEVITSPNAVNDGRWHFVVLSASATSQTMYLDGTAVGTNAGTLTNSGATSYVYLGTGYLGGSWPDEPDQSSTSSTGYASYFAGSMAEFAAFSSQLSSAQVADEWAAAKASQGLSPVLTAQVTDPGGHTLSWSYDPLNGYRLIAQTDGDGATTRYGYDSEGFLSTVTDPDGDVTSYGYDVRGNMVSQTSCQDRATQDCSTSYYDYYPDDTTEDPTPDPRNDMMTASMDPRSSSATDTRYKTSYGYNVLGELTSVTGP
ncbi:MAG: LamG-like jellyroll fold domain-containing protein, partial [Streptosporangiaceae bacterium]